MKVWKTPPSDRERSRAAAAELGISNFAAMLLFNRGMTDAASCRAFLEAEKTAYVDPMTLPDMKKAVDRIEKAVRTGENITIFGDYDVDGITATAVLYSYLKDTGAQVRYMLPSRDDGGYGLNNDVVDRLNVEGTRLIITVDNGISARKEIAYAASLGIDTVVTDHHKPPEQLPDACAVVDAFVREGDALPFREWAGVGIAYKLVCALEISRAGEDSEAVGARIAERYGEYIALGSIADIVPLTGENRRLTAAGMRKMRQSPAPGISALIGASRLDRGKIRAVDVAFSLAPKLNSAGRMGSPYRALELVLCADKEKADALAEELCAVNISRSMQEQAISSEVFEKLEKDRELLYRPVTIICGKGWNTGIVGIFASRLCEKLGKPAIVLSVLSDDETTARGSGRCFGDFSLYKALTACDSLLEMYGGHSQAAGMTVKTENLLAFGDAINRYADQFGEMPVEELVCDCELHPAYLSVGLIKECAILEPFGARNPQPSIVIRKLKITEVIPITNGKHHRITAARDGVSITMMYFNSDHRFMRYRAGDEIDVVVTPDIDTYMGQEKLKLIIKDILPSGFDTGRAIYETRCFERLMRGKDITDEQREMLSPTRQHIADVYRLICKNGYTGTKEILIHRAEEHGVSCGKLLVSLEALEEAGIINKRDTGDAWIIEMCGETDSIKIKADINDCGVMIALGRTEE